jgi:hypothetical protein
MRKNFLLVLVFAIAINTSANTSWAYPRLNWRSADFEGRRFIAETAWQTEAEAQKRGEVLHYENDFSNLGVLWIPYYKNLSGKKLYQTIIVPDGNCDRFLRQYRQKLKRTAYCFTPSNQGLPANRRGA